MGNHYYNIYCKDFKYVFTSSGRIERLLLKYGFTHCFSITGTPRPHGKNDIISGTDWEAKRLENLMLVRKRMVTALQITWDSIGSDWLRMLGESDVPRSEVIEAVTDADRLLIQGRDSCAAEAFYELPKGQQKLILREAFPQKTYGY